MTTKTTERDLVDQVEELLAKATPEPWAIFSDATSYVEEVTGRTYGFMVAPADNRPGHIAVELTREDAELITRARNDLLRRMVEEVKRLRLKVDAITGSRIRDLARDDHDD